MAEVMAFPILGFLKLVIFRFFLALTDNSGVEWSCKNRFLAYLGINLI